MKLDLKAYNHTVGSVQLTTELSGLPIYLERAASELDSDHIITDLGRMMTVSNNVARVLGHTDPQYSLDIDGKHMFTFIGTKWVRL